MAVYTNTYQRDIAIEERLFVLVYSEKDEEVFMCSNMGTFEWDCTVATDEGNAFSAWWRSKDLDFLEQFPQYKDMWKTVYTVQVEYEDMTVNTPIVVGVSIDGGATYVSKTRLVGTGDGLIKTADFHFIDQESGITGKLFVFKIECTGTTEFKFMGANVFFVPRGEYFEI